MSRLIDADAFERDLTEHILPILIQRYGEEEAIRGLHFSYSDCISNISGQPTIEERMQGKWILHPEIKNVYGGTVIQCSECSEKYVVRYLEDEKYCRNCGAKMEVENETD